MVKFFANKENLLPQFIANLLSVVVYIVTLKVFLPSDYKFGMIYTLCYSYLVFAHVGNSLIPN